MMNRVDLTKYSEEHKLPFAQVFGWYMMGLFLSMLRKNGFLEQMWLVTPGSLDPAQDRHVLEEGLGFYYAEDERITKNDGFVPGCQMKSDFRERLLMKLQMDASKEKLPLEIKSIGAKERVEIHYDGMYFPLKIRIDRAQEGVFPKDEDFEFFDPKIQKIPVHRYPSEEEAADHVNVIMEKLELLNEMEEYLQLYDLISTTPMSGRDVTEAIGKRLRNSGRSAKKSTYQLWAGYSNSPFLKKKWKVLLRRHQIKSPTWEEVHQQLSLFIEPVWETLEKEEIFFGDWMPGLGRYLD